jgi:hypothetical protein
MTKHDHHLFTLRDAMILVAAAGPAFAMSASSLVSTALCWNPWQQFYGSFGPYWRRVPGCALVEWFGGPEIKVDEVVLVLDFVFPLLMLETLAILVLGICRPHPEWRALLGQPGAVACGAASLMIVGVLWAAEFGVRLSPAIVGGAVGAAWIAMALLCGWRSEPSWVDRAGRLLGGIWLVTIPVIVWIEWHT